MQPQVETVPRRQGRQFWYVEPEHITSLNIGLMKTMCAADITEIGFCKIKEVAKYLDVGLEQGAPKSENPGMEGVD